MNSNKSLREFVVTIGLTMIVVPAATILWFILGFFADSTDSLVAILIVLLLAGIYPISAITYFRYRRPVRLQKLNSDFLLLGFLQDSTAQRLPRTVSTQQSAIDVEESYNELYSPQNFAIQSLMITLATVLGLLLLFDPANMVILQTLGADTVPALRFGFLGSYIFAAQLVYRRYTTFDLQPSVYFYGTLTMIGGIFFNFALFETTKQLTGPSPDPTTGAPGVAVGVVAFALGYFPYLAIRYLNRIAYSLLRVNSHRESDLGLGLIDGISIFHEVRLRDEGIDNIQNLVSVRIDELLINTRFSAQQVVEWIDQGMLYLYLNADNKKKEGLLDAIRRLTKMGIRGVTDLHEQWIPEYQIRLELVDNQTIVQPVLRKNASDEEMFRNFRQTYAKIGQPAIVNRTEKAPDASANGHGSDINLSEQSSTTDAEALADWIRQLDALYVATLHGPNSAYIHEYWRNIGRVIGPYQQELADYTLETVRRLIPDRVSQFVKRDLEDFAVQPKQVIQENIKASSAEEIGKIKASVKQVERKETLSGLESLGYARVLQANGDLDEAVSYFQQALRQDSELIDAYNDLAWLYVNDKKTNLEEAEKLARKGLEVAAKHNYSHLDQAHLYDTLAAILLKQVAQDGKHNAEAKIEESRRLLSQIKDDPKIYSEIPAQGRIAVDRHWSQLLEMEQLLEVTS